MATSDAALGKIPVSLAQLQDVHPDTVDFRDKMYVPTLVEVPVRRTLQEYLDCFKKYAPGRPPILNQGHEGACTGFGLATVANYLLRRRQVVPDDNASARACSTKWRSATTNGRAKNTTARLRAAP